MTLADRIAIMNDGSIQQIGRPTKVYSDPANMFVAHFIGSPNINFFDVDLEEPGGSTTLVGETFTYEISGSLADRLRAETDRTELVLGVRPENVLIEEAPEEGRTIAAEVVVVETVGSDNFIYCEVAGDEVRVRAPTRILPEADETLHLTFDESDVYLFDRETEESVLRREQVEPAVAQ